MSLNRRTFLKTGVAAAAVAAVPRPLVAQLGRTPEPVPPIEDPRLAALAARALDSARSSGAAYADIRLTHTRTREFMLVQDEEDMEVGVRALVDGYWGFASGPVWSPDEMARLGREAVHQAKTNAMGKPREVALAPAPVVQNGSWVMPVTFDPFEISPFEIQDHVNALEEATGDTGVGVMNLGFWATVQDKAFASTAGSYCTQRCYRSWGSLVLTKKNKVQEVHVPLDCLSDAGMGWELFAGERIPRVRDHSLREEIRQRAEELKEDMLLPIKPVDVGRYDAVFDVTSVARLVDATLGRATELDRALGYEANAGGTSYISDPLGMLGSYQAGGPMLTVTANRSEPGGAATVHWDDEGVAPDEFTLVKDGVLSDFQTTRESAGWLKASYAKSRTPGHSHGCASAPSAIYAPLQHSPNLMLAPGRDAGDFEGLVRSMSDGIAIKGATFEMDFQHSSGLGLGRVFEIKRGKRVAQLVGAGFLFRSSDLWKSLIAVGGDAHLRRYGIAAAKGEPPQTCYHSVTAPPVVVKGLTVIDPMRKA
ncbi:MAG TPA: TldD/PmbA family protein [Gemmatimonadaceae bacterium]|nr:TldD/PmbA family protein [Gemmatimonadaceae bacterium]